MKRNSPAPKAIPMSAMNEHPANVRGGLLQTCSTRPVTGFLRNGQCQVTDEDVGNHSVCVELTDDFLRFSRARGNDLSTPREEFGFPGLRGGQRWCLCAARWLEAYEDGVAPQVVLASCEWSTLDLIPLELLKAHAAPGA